MKWENTKAWVSVKDRLPCSWKGTNNNFSQVDVLVILKDRVNRQKLVKIATFTSIPGIEDFTIPGFDMVGDSEGVLYWTNIPEFPELIEV